jgi:hypothetical protein
MPLVPIEQVGQVGIIQDVPPYELPPNAWSGGNNVRVLDSGIKKIRGYTEALKTITFPPYYLTPYEDSAGTYYWLAFGQNKVAVWDGSTWTDITRQATNTLNGAINASVTTITLTDASSFPVSGTIAIGTKQVAAAATNYYEEITYTGKSTNDLTGCTRASTDPAAHDDLSVVTPIGTTATTDNNYAATENTRRWTATNLNGLLIATNGYDAPQMWPLNSSGVPAKTVPLRELQNWSVATTKEAGNSTNKSEVIRSFRTFLVGLNWTNVVARNNVEPRLVKWSTEASYFSAPVTWDSSDATLDAGEYELADTPGVILDGLPLGDSFIIYKNDSIYIMNYVGTPYIFSFKLLSPTIGALCKNSVVDFEGGHFFMGNSNFYLCNGQTVTPLLTGKLRRAVFDDIVAGDLNDPTWQKSFVVADHVHKEILACYPTQSSSVINKAVIWNWEKNTFTFRDLPNTSHIAAGILAANPGGKLWDTATKTWNEDSEAWGSSDYDSHLENLVFADVSNTKFYRDNAGNQEDTTNMTSYIERSGYDLGDPQSVKFVSAVYPQIEVSGDNTVNVYIGRQMSTEGGITWEGPIAFNPNTQSKVSCRVSGKYFGVKVESTTDIDWRLHGLAFEVQQSGTRGIRSYG